VILFSVDEDGGLVSLGLDCADLTEVSSQLIFRRFWRNADDLDSI